MEGAYHKPLFLGFTTLLKLSVWLCLVVASACYANPKLEAALANGAWGACPQLTIEGLSVSSFPLLLNVESLDIDISCLLKQTEQQKTGFEPALWRAPVKLLFQQLKNIPAAFNGSRIAVKQLNIKHGKQLLAQGELSLSQRGQQWQLKFSKEQGSDVELLVVAHTQTLQLKGQLAPLLLNTLAQQFKQTWLADERLANLQFSLSVDVEKDLLVSTNLKFPALTASLDAQFKGWENWQLSATHSGFDLDSWTIPTANWQFQQKSWNVNVEEWQLSGSGTWQLQPKLAIQGSLNSDDLIPLQQHFYTLPKPANLLSAAADLQFTWQNNLLSGKLKAQGINALWGELRFDDGALNSEFSFKPEQGLQHSGSLALAQWDIGIPLTQLALNWLQAEFAPLAQWQSLVMQDINFKVLGGSAQIKQLPLALPNVAKLELNKVQLAELVKLYPELGLTMHGSVSGNLPVHFSEHGIAIADGSLAVVEPSGHIALTHQSLVAIKAQHPSLDFALSLLEDFDYETLAAEVDFAEDGQLDMQVKLIGRNQRVSPRLVTLNYRHQENIYQLLRSLRIGEQLSGQLQQWIDDTSSSP
ncbi:intermembrane phospholipid transport protein YdbH family protein [Agarivorans aestuarii]|uniref:intermembrane phospholipid transport protein YdbH family protein n=1 Tax=Agarivorans aestuarii TaxID=1563703 RepID=UPI001C8240BC|nr:YdbH domain-containing protein [Agarivorans aestuarii]